MGSFFLKHSVGLGSGLETGFADEAFTFQVRVRVERSPGLSSRRLKYINKRCSVIAERPSCRVRYSFGQKWKTGTGRQYSTDIIGLSSTTVI